MSNLFLVLANLFASGIVFAGYITVWGEGREIREPEFLRLQYAIVSENFISLKKLENKNNTLQDKLYTYLKTFQKTYERIKLRKIKGSTKLRLPKNKQDICYYHRRSYVEIYVPVKLNIKEFLKKVSKKLVKINIEHMDSKTNSETSYMFLNKYYSDVSPEVFHNMMIKSRKKANQDAKKNITEIIINNNYCGSKKFISKKNLTPYYDEFASHILIQGRQIQEFGNIWSQQVILISKIEHNYYLKPN